MDMATAAIGGLDLLALRQRQCNGAGLQCPRRSLAWLGRCGCREGALSSSSSCCKVKKATCRQQGGAGQGEPQSLAGALALALAGDFCAPPCRADSQKAKLAQPKGLRVKHHDCKAQAASDATAPRIGSRVQKSNLLDLFPQLFSTRILRDNA